MKNVYIIAGPNGAGKTTFAREFLPNFAHCNEFVNADLVATGLSPFSPQRAGMQAGRLVLRRIRELTARGDDFGFETTLSGRTYQSLLRRLRKRGYHIQIFFLWIPTVELAITRVKDRVRRGGHDVPEADIRRRFRRGLANIFGAYRPLLDSWIVFDNSGKPPRVVAFGSDVDTQVVDSAQFQKLHVKSNEKAHH